MSETGQPFESPPLGPRMRSLVASCFVALASGTTYAYSVYAPQLVKNSGLTPADAGKLSLALSIGGSIGGFPAGILIDAVGPGPADFIGSLVLFFSFSTLYKAYLAKSDHVLTYVIALAASSFGSILSFYSTVNCVTANFPHHRGTAGALPVASYALASLLYSSISVRFFEGNTGGLLKFFAVFAASVCFAGSFFLKLVKKPKSSPDETSQLLRRGSSNSVVDTILETRKQFKNKLSLWGIGRSPSNTSLSTPRFSIDSSVQRPKNLQRVDSEVIYVAVEDVPIFVRYGSPIWNHHIVKKILSRVYVKFFIILASLQAIGQLYIYSVGYVVVTLKDSNPDSKIGVSDAQALQVSTIAVASFLGRLSSGPISDLVRKKLNAQRLWCIFAASFMTAFGQFLLRTINDLEHLFIPSFIIGFAFGFCFGTFPAVIADTFGINGFTTMWGFLTTGAVFLLSWLTKNLAQTLEKHSDSQGLCTLGVECYKDTFTITQYGAFGIATLILYTIYFNYRTGKN